jgi:hypothetical protein
MEETPTELQSYLSGAKRDLTNEVRGWASSALSSLNSMLRSNTGKGLEDYGVPVAGSSAPVPAVGEWRTGRE